MSSGYHRVASTRLGVRYRRDAPFTDIPSRPRREFEIRKSSLPRWAIYRKYHYLNTDISKSVQCYELFEKDVPVAFLAVIHQPTTSAKNVKRVSRLVVLPDYQGIGIGGRFLDAIAEYYDSRDFIFEIKTSARNLIGSLQRNAKWKCASWGFTSPRSGKTATANHSKARTQCKTASFFYNGKTKKIKSDSSSKDKRNGKRAVRKIGKSSAGHRAKR